MESFFISSTECESDPREAAFSLPLFFLPPKVYNQCVLTYREGCNEKETKRL